MDTPFPLLAAKLRVPSPPKKGVPRPQLIARLNEGWESGRRLTLFSAPAGFGKTTCAAEWLAALRAPAAWLALDTADDDPGRFFAYFVAALQTIQADIGGGIEGVLRAGEIPPEEVLLANLGNDILDLEERFVLVLDDFQIIQDGLTLRILEKLIAAPLQPLHMVLLTREDPSLPLARLRANNQLTEIRAADLRFNAGEAESFLNQTLGLSLPVTDVAALEERTEGWVVGLQLAGLSLRAREDPAPLIAGLSGGKGHILNYLTEEVLNHQSDETRRFLLQTSILERLGGDICDAVTGRADGRATLDRLARANLFLEPLDLEGQWYRYHPLFADLLQDRLRTQPEESIEELHRSAANWYERAGMASEAIRHFLAAAEYAAAVRLIETHAMDLLMQWHVKTVDGWMRSIPPEWIAQSIRANLAFAWVHLMHRAHMQAIPYLQRLEVLFSESQSGERDDPSLKAKWLAMQAMMMNPQGKAAESLQLTRRALEIAPQGDTQARFMIHMVMADAYERTDDHDRAATAFQEIIRQGQEIGNSIYELLGVSGLALITINRGQLRKTYEIASRGIERVERSGSLPPISMAIYGELGVVCYQWHRLEEAHRHFQRAIQVGTLSGYSDAKLFYAVILSRLYQLEGKTGAAGKAIREAADLMRSESALFVREEVIAQLVRVLLAEGRPAEAESLLQREGFSFAGEFSYPDPGPGKTLLPSAGSLYAAALRILLQRDLSGRTPANLQAGIALADRLAADALRRGYILSAVEILLLRAHLHAAAGDGPQSESDYLQALKLAEPEGIIGLFVEEGAAVAESLARLLGREVPDSAQPEFIKTVLAVLSGPPAPKRDEAEALIAQLTDREREVLRLMAEGLQYEEVAVRLVVSLNTVRSHVKSIYGKLGVNNRTKAIEIAHQLQIL